jgi:hypothetical protein
VPPVVYDVLRSPGQPLDAATRAFFEPRFGHDFSRVRVHTGEEAAESASLLGAAAYTVGRDIAFSRQSYNPSTPAGKGLLAHELAHVAQQGSDSIHSPAAIRIGAVNSPLEREADAAERLAVAGEKSWPGPVNVSTHGRPALQRRCACVSSAPGASASILPLSTPAPASTHPSIAVPNSRNEAEFSLLTGLFATELVAAFRDLHGGGPRREAGQQQRPRQMPGQPRVRMATPGQAEVERLGVAWGAHISKSVLGPRSEIYQNAFGALSDRSPVPPMREVDDPGDSDDPTLTAASGVTSCNVPLGLPSISVSNRKCTAPCTLLHESTHFWDISPCCVSAGIAWRAAPPAGKAAVVASWGSWIRSNRDFFECRAYRVSQTCGTALSNIALCSLPKSLVRGVFVVGGAVVGGVIGAQLLGGAGAATGGAAGLAGGPAAPVTVPAGATAGFISGELLGFLGGAAIGALAGVAADELRRRCCDDVSKYLSVASAKITAHCASGAAVTPCPF